MFFTHFFFSFVLSSCNLVYVSFLFVRSIDKWHFFRCIFLDFFSGESDDDDFAAASGTPGNSGSSDDSSSGSYGGSSYGGASPMYGSGVETGGLGGLGLGASPFAGGSLPSLYGAYGAASHPKVKVVLPSSSSNQKRK